ncbi:ankyrin repeat-containing domain protein [Obelidium mucronatum]|nr:ankyrin repeat-containing domain protein [Obelidium mucronatum]
MVVNLLHTGAACNAVDRDAWTPLHYAAEGGHDAIIAILLKAGASVNAKTKSSSTTALHLTSIHGNAKAVSLLIDAGADLDTPNNTFLSTPLHHSARFGHFDICRILIEKGATKTPPNNELNTPIHLAASYDHKEIVSLFLDHNAVDNNCKQVVSLLGSWTPLHLAVSMGSRQISALLLANGATVNCVDKYKNTPLHLAAEKGFKEIAMDLMHCGADLGAESVFGWTPLLAAVDHNQMEVVDLLLLAPAPAAPVSSLESLLDCWSLGCSVCSVRIGFGMRYKCSTCSKSTGQAWELTVNLCEGCRHGHEHETLFMEHPVAKFVDFHEFWKRHSENALSARFGTFRKTGTKQKSW